MAKSQIIDLPLDRVFGNPDQPRKKFADAELQDLAQSIQENDLLQPIKVTPRGDRWMIILGERRFRAHQILGAATIPAIVQDDMADVDVLIEAIVENGQRVDVHPLEEAVAYQACLDQGVSIDDLARRLGLRQPWRVSDRVLLLNLRPEYQLLMRTGQLTHTQGTKMAALTPEAQDEVFRAIRRGECSTPEELRSRCLLLRTEGQQGDFMGADTRAPASWVERELVKALECRFAKVASVLRASTIDNEIVAVKKINPSRADTMADLLAAMRGDLHRIELALRKSASTGPVRAA